MLNDENKATVADVTALAAIDENSTPAEIRSSGMSKADARAWLAATVLLHARLGRPVRPADFVAFAQTTEGKPIRHMFTWDNAEAADNFRALEAAHWCRMVKVVVAADQGPIRAIVHVTNGDRSGYVTLNEAVGRDDYRRQVLAEAARDLRLFKAKYSQLQAWLNSPALSRALEALGEIESEVTP
jgi:hypothetical protein